MSICGGTLTDLPLPPLVLAEAVAAPIVDAEGSDIDDDSDDGKEEEKAEDDDDEDDEDDNDKGIPLSFCSTSFPINLAAAVARACASLVTASSYAIVNELGDVADGKDE
jgi:hypothetical protein